MTENGAAPEPLRTDIRRATEILKEAGCYEIYLFGSAATGKAKDGSDIDLAVRGCPSGRFFQLLGRLFWELHRPVDLVNLDSPSPFARYLNKEGYLLRIG
jgi:predicted nucleotidyltransferase